MEGLRELEQLLGGRRLAVLTGAGVSTGSGIPDYRSPGRPQRTPIQHREFVHAEAVRRRYWARSVLGWPRIASARPNAVHDAIARLELAGRITGLVTQNVDRLHHRAGSREVVELHGALADVVCLACGAMEARADLQARLVAANPGFAGDPELGEAESRPDGDAELDAEVTARFVVPACLRCDGVLMPDVVFFGGTVPRSRVERAMGLVESADALLVLGSSLTVFSGWRFVRRAHERGLPVAIVNRGPTRGDPQATIKLESELAEVVPTLVASLVSSGAPRGATERA